MSYALALGEFITAGFGTKCAQVRDLYTNVGIMKEITIELK